MLDITVHDADTLRFVLDDEPVAVTAMVQQSGMSAAGIFSVQPPMTRTRATFAIVSGVGLIVAALLLACVYVWLCRPSRDKGAGE